MQTIRDWVLAFNADGPDGLIVGKAPGQTPKLTAEQRQALKAIVEDGPTPAIHGVVRWRLVHLVQWIRAEYGISVSRQSLPLPTGACAGCRRGRATPLRILKPPKPSKKVFAETDASAVKLARGRMIEVWFQDEARVSQKNKITRRWARRGPRPPAPHDQRTRSAYIFGAICPALGKAAGLGLHRCDTPAMNLHLAEIAMVVDPGAHAIVLLDQAGWHTAKDPNIPANISLLPATDRGSLSPDKGPAAVDAGAAR